MHPIIDLTPTLSLPLTLPLTLTLTLTLTPTLNQTLTLALTWKESAGGGSRPRDLAMMGCMSAPATIGDRGCNRR